LRLLHHFSPGALVVMGITFVLFSLALVTHGITHDLLLESAVFLISVKLMLMTHRNSIQARALDAKLDRNLAAILERGSGTRSTEAGNE